MLTVGVYASNQTGIGEPLATLSYSGQGKKVIIATDNITVKEELTSFLDTVLSFPKQGRVPPEDRKLWMESLPVAQVSVPYWFKIADFTSEIIEEVDNGNEDIEEDNGEEAEENGGDEGNGDDSDDGESSNGGLPNTNGQGSS